jgi:hypothetical protein
MLTLHTYIESYNSHDPHKTCMNHPKPTPKSNFNCTYTHTLSATGYIKFDHNLTMSKKNVS